MRNLVLSAICGFIGAMLFQMVHSELVRDAKAGGERIISATRFDLVDASGKVRAQLGTAKEGPPGFWMMDERGVARISMGLYPDGTSHIGLQDKDGAMIQLMRSIGSSESPLLIFKNKGEDRMILGLNSAQTDPAFVSFDKKTRKKTVYPGFSDAP